MTKGEGEWQHLKPAILGAIMEHFMAGLILDAEADPRAEDGEEFFDEGDAPTVATIKELLETASGRRWPATAATSPSGATGTGWSISP